MASEGEPRVFLVGAGPGDPGLLTVRAAELLASADLILYDQLVPRRLIDFANPAAEAVCVRDLPGTHPDKYPHIYTRMIEAAQAGRRVVRLKGGDPLIFGRGGEEAEALREAGLAYEIVPGVTAALAAAACLDIPITHRKHTSAVAFLTGHELPSKPGNKLDWQALARFPGTLAIYMGIARLPIIVSELLRWGKDPHTPAAIVERASTGDMRSVMSRLVDLEADRRSAGLEAPGLILIGEAVRYRRDVSWFESRPLFGKRVLVTRPRHQANDMVRRLEHLGAVPFTLPTVEIREPSDFGPLDRAIQKVSDGEYDWVAFASANAVRAVLDRLLSLGRDLRVLGRVKLAAVGPKTAEVLREYHLRADVTPAAAFSAGTLSQLLIKAVTGQRVLLPRADRGKQTLLIELGKVATVEAVVAYEQVDAVDVHGDAYASLRRGEIEYVTLSSGNIARSLLASFDETIRGRVQRGEMKLVAISDGTAEAIQELGYPVAGVAETATSDGLIAAVRRLATTSRP